ncbi:30S ribosomal protein S16 [Candidatus Photodesmus blepharus]|uniref:Small ribosomal subunit protein bS16 n=1 Tax=Candidatus Photodesmus blepharonis TaxID=1179155 RepID=A0A084CP56_9GAMM|nr:30S ribosomal protein S16 [Candidatus Photodesmus blepharus]KEY91585.1 30S ribosomal protein S16 [Candidatus Photodesmus blepharus]
MVTIRLARHGTKRHPFYKIMVASSRNSATGRFIEKVGFFNPIASSQERKLYINLERIKYWISQGASVSNRVNKLVNDFKKSSLTLFS